MHSLQTGCHLQGLLLELLALVPEDQLQQRGAVLLALGSSLKARGLHEDAAVAFLAAGDDDQALLQYQASGQWQMAFAMAGVNFPVLFCQLSTQGVCSAITR